MQNLINAIEVLRNSINTEETLRQAARVEWANENKEGPMKQAHDIAIQNVISASKNLIALVDTM